jgi:ABC-type multidrug transport system ATPase subunit
VEVAGFSLPAEAIELKQRIGYVPETAELYETLSARASLLFSLQLLLVEGCRLPSRPGRNASTYS